MNNFTVGQEVMIWHPVNGKPCVIESIDGYIIRVKMNDGNVINANRNVVFEIQKTGHELNLEAILEERILTIEESFKNGSK